MWVMWLAFMMATMNSVVAQFVDNYNNANNYIAQTLLIMAHVRFGHYQDNMFQFGMDQLHDASMDDITSFICISWYAST